MMYAVKQDPNNLNYVSDLILTDEMIDIALSTGNYVFDAKEASGKLKQNSKVMLEAVKQDPNNLNYALAEALTDEMIDIALSSEKYIFDGKVASYALRCNSRVMLYAIKQDPNSLNYVPKEALTDEIIDIALSTGNYVFDDKEASYKLKQNPKVMMYAVKHLEARQHLHLIQTGDLSQFILQVKQENNILIKWIVSKQNLICWRMSKDLQTNAME